MWIKLKEERKLPEDLYILPLLIRQNILKNEKVLNNVTIDKC